MITHTISAPRVLPFHAESFAWDHFERFCAMYFVADTSLPNLSFKRRQPKRLSILDAERYGTSGSNQKGIDLLMTMENHATWVLQCKRMSSFTKSNAEKAIAKAEAEFGYRRPERYLLWVTGKVSTDASDLVHEHHPNWTLWDGERMTNEFLLHTPPRQAQQIITSIFGPNCGKDFFPIPDDLLIAMKDFYSRWKDHAFLHQTAFVGRKDFVGKVAAFARGGKGRKALILSAPGGIGKTSLLRAAAKRVETEMPGRAVRFTNPEASSDARLPSHKDASLMTVFHDDAHRIETIPKLLLRILADQPSEGSRLILATRPGTEDALRECLMEAGYSSTEIEVLPVKKLTKKEMLQLASACLGKEKKPWAQALADLSDGCALITVAGGALLRSGELTNLDLVQSAHFRAEVFRRFEGQELDRLRGSLDRPVVEKLLRSIALLTPWKDSDQTAMDRMAEFLGISGGQLDAIRDSLLLGGLLTRTYQGLRITPDLFSDHLAYLACYTAEGEKTGFIGKFLDHFAEAHPQILHNLAEAEWRAIEQHGSSASSVIASIWRQFLDEFAKASFFARSDMVKQWSKFAVYQPKRSLELAGWALDLTTEPEKAEDWASGICTYTHEDVLEHVPALVKPVAIWSSEHRQAALNLLWRLRHDFPMPETKGNKEQYSVFATIANFKHNFPDAQIGALDWLDRLFASEEALSIFDKPCSLLDTVLRPFFAKIVEHTHMSDHRTMVFSKIPISVTKTKALRDRAMAFLTEKIVPRGTVAAMNALSPLAEAFRQTASFDNLPSKADQAWRPERMRTLKAIEKIAIQYDHPLIHYAIRHQLHWHIVYGKDKHYRNACENIVALLPDTFDLRLARLTLSWSHDDLFAPYDHEHREEWHEKHKSQWTDLKQQVASELLTKYPDASLLHDFLNQWISMCAEHGLTTHMGELLAEVAWQNQPLAFEVLELVFQSPHSKLTGYAGTLINREINDLAVVEALVQRAFECDDSFIACSFLNTIQYRDELRSEGVKRAMLTLAAHASGPTLQHLFNIIQFPSQKGWTGDLLLILLSRSLTDEEAGLLSEAICIHLRDAHSHIDENAIFKLIDRIAEAKQINVFYDKSDFFHEMARRYPRRMYELLIKRIQYQEQGSMSDNGFKAFPYPLELSLAGMKKESDFESIAKYLLRQVMESAPEHRWMWKQMFQITVARASELTAPLLAECLTMIIDAEALTHIAGLLGFDKSLLVFQHPALARSILQKARKFGPEVYDHITRQLIRGVELSGRGYSEGELQPQYYYLREEAAKASRIHEFDPILGPFYQKIVETELFLDRILAGSTKPDAGEDW